MTGSAADAVTGPGRLRVPRVGRRLLFRRGRSPGRDAQGRFHCRAVRGFWRWFRVTMRPAASAAPPGTVARI